MEQARVLPNDVTFIGLLTTCYLLIRTCGRWMEDLLSACKIHRRVTMREYAAKKLFFSCLGSCRKKIWILMEEGLSKDLGYSLIERVFVWDTRRI
ncbi:hypothetical protein TorRG33x02_215690 [Trema orientale]|uniref:Uncharacterized protein n=1 Tax=Trema orientale TaxID=63057 RepID=A0A2P5EAW8_TREOI|nr:hypothetical protein TorRG33x02_215690 [Trema orientale]